MDQPKRDRLLVKLRLLLKGRRPGQMAARYGQPRELVAGALTDAAQILMSSFVGWFFERANRTGSVSRGQRTVFVS